MVPQFSNIEDAAIKRAMVEHAAETIALAGAEKLGMVSPFQVAPLKDFSLIITDQSAPAGRDQRFEGAGHQYY